MEGRIFPDGAVVKTGAFTAMGQGLIPGRGNKIPQAMWRGQKKQKWGNSMNRQFTLKKTQQGSKHTHSQVYILSSNQRNVNRVRLQKIRKLDNAKCLQRERSLESSALWGDAEWRGLAQKQSVVLGPKH